MKLMYTVKERVLRSPYYIAVNLWNQIDEDIQSIDDIEKFKRHVKALDLDNLKCKS